MAGQSSVFVGGAAVAAAPTAYSSILLCSYLYLLSLPLLTPIASRNVLLYQSLPTSVRYRHANFRRRNDDTGVGTAARRMTEGRHRFPRRVQPHGGPPARCCRALPTRTGGRGRRAPCAPLPPGAAVPRGPQECREDRRLGRCRATGPARLRWHRPLGSSAIGHRVGRTGGRAVGGIRWHHRLRSEQLSQTRHTFSGRQAPVVWPPGQGRHLPGGCLHGIRPWSRACLARLPLVPP